MQRTLQEKYNLWFAGTSADWKSQETYCLKKYRFEFDIWGLLLFFFIMMPNFIWFAVPAPNDILRTASSTVIVDTVAYIAQVVMMFFLCVIGNKEKEKMRITKLIIATVACVLFYFACWVIYYSGRADAGVILGLTVFPCLAFLFYSLDRKNMPAFVPALIFTICHFIYAVVNYIA